MDPCSPQYVPSVLPSRWVVLTRILCSCLGPGCGWLSCVGGTVLCLPLSPPHYHIHTLRHCMWGAPPTKRFSAAPARGPTVQSGSDTISPMLVQMPHTRLPPLQTARAVRGVTCPCHRPAINQGSHDALLGLDDLLKELTALSEIR